MGENTGYVILLMVSSVITFSMALYAYAHVGRRGAKEYVGLSVAVTLYSFGYAMELTSSRLPDMLFWLKVQYLGIPAIPVFWLWMCMGYMGIDRYRKPVFIGGTLLLPLLTYLLYYTNDYHHLFYSYVAVHMGGPFPVALLGKGPWYWVHIAYSYVALLAGNLLMLWFSRQTANIYRRQLICLAIGSLIPLSGNLLYLLGWSPWGLDLGPVMISIANPLYAWAIWGSQMFELIPVARSKVFESVRDGVIILDQANRVVDYNPAAQEIVVGLGQNQLGRHVTEVCAELPELAEQIISDEWERDLKVVDGIGFRWYQSRLSWIRDKRGVQVGKVVLLGNVTAQTMLMERLQALATVDGLTRIYNRRHFIEQVRIEFQKANLTRTPLTFIMMDVDSFKVVNDRYGHEAGDRVLRVVANLCRRNVREGDIVGRYGGEEFAMCLPGATVEEGWNLAERLRGQIESHPIPINGESVRITASFGVAGTLQFREFPSLRNLVRTADQALYRAKAAGRNQVFCQEKDSMQ